MKQYKHLVFDIDGTILDTADVNMVSLQRALLELRGEKKELEDLAFSFGIPGTSTMAILGFPDPQAALNVWIRHYVECGEELGIRLFPGMGEVLEALQKTDAFLGIITSKQKDEYDRDFEKRDLKKYFHCAVTSSDTERGKPYPDPMLEYMKRTGARPEKTLYIGDSVYDMDSARAAGVDHALALWGCLNPEGIASTWRLERVEEILKFV